MFHSWQVNSFYQGGMRVECNALLWPLLQFRCCGVTNHTDWFEVYNTTRVPDSCCLEYSDNCGLDNPGTWWTAVRPATPAAPPPVCSGGDQRGSSSDEEVHFLSKTNASPTFTRVGRKCQHALYL